MKKILYGARREELLNDWHNYRFADRRELFADLTHLNSDGAEEFTKLLNETVLRRQKGTDL